MNQPMEQKHGEDIEMVLIQHMVRLLNHHNLNGSQARNLLEKVRVLVDAQNDYKSQVSLPTNLP